MHCMPQLPKEVLRATLLKCESILNLGAKQLRLYKAHVLCPHLHYNPSPCSQSYFQSVHPDSFRVAHHSDKVVSPSIRTLDA